MTVKASDVSPRGYSQVTVLSMQDVAGLVFVSGQVALDETGAVVGEGDVAAQTAYVFEQLRRRLEAAGSGLAHVAKITVFLRDFSAYGEIVRQRQALFPPEAPPASSAVAVSALVDERLLVEIEAVAAIPRGAA